GVLAPAALGDVGEQADQPFGAPVGFGDHAHARVQPALVAVGQRDAQVVLVGDAFFDRVAHLYAQLGLVGVADVAHVGLIAGGLGAARQAVHRLDIVGPLDLVGRDVSFLEAGLGAFQREAQALFETLHVSSLNRGGLWLGGSVEYLAECVDDVRVE